MLLSPLVIMWLKLQVSLLMARSSLKDIEILRGDFEYYGIGDVAGIDGGWYFTQLFGNT